MRFDRDEFNTTPRTKEALRRQLADDVEAFLKSGGEIEIIPPNSKSDLAPDWDSISEFGNRDVKEAK